MPYWKVVVAAEAPVAPNGVRPDQVDLEVRDLRVLSPTATRFSLAGPATILEGGFGPVSDIAMLRVIVRLDRFASPGRYEGRIRVSAVTDLGRGPRRGEWGPVAQAEIRYSFDVGSFGLISLDPGGLRLDAGEPGVHECASPMWAVAESNRPTFRLKASMSALVHSNGQGRVSPADTCIAWGATPAEAIANVRAAPFGRNEDAVQLQRGRHKLFVAAKARNDLSTPPGLYRGHIQVWVED